jgi:hypothetical protein
MGKKLLLLAATVLILPSALRADSTNFFFSGGTLSGANGVLSLTNSPLYGVTGLGSPVILGSNLGTVDFTTGSLQVGSTELGVFFPGGIFTVTGSGASGIPAGVLFTGEFGSRTGWSNILRQDGTYAHVLHGGIAGIWEGQPVIAEMELFVETQGKSFSSAGQRIRGSVLIPTTVPEPETLAFLGLGMAGLIGAVFAKSRRGAVSAC